MALQLKRTPEKDGIVIEDLLTERKIILRLSRFRSGSVHLGITAEQTFRLHREENFVEVTPATSMDSPPTDFEQWEAA